MANPPTGPMRERLVTAPAQILRPGDGLVDVIVRRHPLRGERSFVRLPAGLSIAELVEGAWPDRAGKPAVAYLADEVVPSELWSRVRPKPGTTILLQPLMQGKGIWRSLAFIAVTVVALLVTGGFAAPLLGTAFAAGTIGAALLGAGISIGGAARIDVHFPHRGALK
jgi:hypothetical protein